MSFNQIKKRAFRIVSKTTYSILLAVLCMMLTVAPVLAYTYWASVAITETGGTTYTMLPVMWSQNNTWLAANGFMESTALDTRVQTLGGLNKPWMVASDRVLTAVPVASDSQTNLGFVSGETAATATNVIVGCNGYVEVPDDATLELGDTFNVAIDGYVDTTVAGDIFSKSGCFDIVSDGAGNIGATIYSAHINTTVEILPDGAGTYTNITNFYGAATHWEAVDEAHVAPSDAEYVLMSSAEAQVDTYTLATPVFLGDFQLINSVTVYWRERDNDVGSVGSSNPVIVLDSVGVLGTPLATSDSFTTHSQTLPRPGGGSWSIADITALQAGVILVASGDASSFCSQVSVVIDYDYWAVDVDVTAAVTSGEHLIEVWADGTDLNIDIDGSTEDTVALAGSSVPDTDSYYIMMADNTVPYADEISITVGGNPVLTYAPITILEAIDSSTANLPDETATGNTGVIYWGTNPAMVGVSLGGLTSAAQMDTLGVSTTADSTDILPESGGTDWRPDVGISATLVANPFRPIVVAISDNTTLTEYQVWVWFGIIFVVFITVLVGTNVRGHHTITGIATGAAIVAMVVMTIFPLLVLPAVVLVIWGGHVSERSPSL